MLTLAITEYMRSVPTSYIHENHISHTGHKIFVRSHDFLVGYHLTTVLNRIEKQQDFCVDQDTETRIQNLVGYSTLW